MGISNNDQVLLSLLCIAAFFIDISRINKSEK